MKTALFLLCILSLFSIYSILVIVGVDFASAYLGASLAGSQPYKFIETVFFVFGVFFLPGVLTTIASYFYFRKLIKSGEHSPRFEIASAVIAMLTVFTYQIYTGI